MIKTNYHTHLLYCNHAVGHAEDYVIEAVNNGFLEIGITDHAPVLESFMTEEEYRHTWSHQPMKMDTMYEKYLPEVRKVKDDYKDKITIYTGFEVEYIENDWFIAKLRKEVDYLNLGAHFFLYNGRILNSYYDVNYETIYGYMNAVIKGMETGLFNTLVHPDLFMFEYKNREGKRKFDADCEIVSRKIIEAAIKNNVYLEINAKGLQNSIVYGDGSCWLYPEIEFWKIVKEYENVKIIIGADAHDPKDLTCENIEKVCGFAANLGLNVSEKMIIFH